MENLTDVTNATISLASIADGKDTNDVLTWDGTAWVSQAPTGGGSLNTLSDPLNPLKSATFRLTDLTAGGRNIYLSDANMLLPAQFLSSNNLLTGNTTSSIIVDGSGSGEKNTAYGKGACLNLTVGDSNTVMGYNALYTDTEGINNIAIGTNALYSSLGGASNIGIGSDALTTLTTGFSNVAVGTGAGASMLDGATNVCIGASAGSAITSGFNNVLIGSGSNGITTGSNNVLIGRNTSINANTAITNCIVIGANTNGVVSNSCVIRNIRGVTTNNANGVAVLIDSSGQLGTVSSSIRFKENVVDQNIADAIYQLRPVTFTYKTDQTHKTQYGLIAEEVADHIPGIVVYDDTDPLQPETVQYHLLPSMLLEVVKKQKAEIDALTARVSALES